MKVITSTLFFTLFLFFITVGALSAQESNSSWLIVSSEGDIITYNGGNFSYIKKLPPINYEIYSNGKSWLIYGVNRVPMLFELNGASLTNLTEELPAEVSNSRFLGIAWDGERWLILFNNSLLQYNGRAFTVSRVTPPEARVIRPVWNGEYWLASGIKEEEPILLRFDTTGWRELSFEKYKGMSGYIHDIGWNGEYWLILVGFYSKDTGLLPKIFKFNGESLVEISTPRNTFDEIRFGEPGKVIPVKLAWNGNYWLIAAESSGTLFSKLLKFDGVDLQVAYKISDRTPPILTDAEVGDIKWGDDTFLMSFSNMREMGAIAKYDDTGFKLLDGIPNFGSLISDFDWGGEYWLIGEYTLTGETALLRYDGTEIVDLTAPLISALPPSSKEDRIGRIVFYPQRISIISIGPKTPPVTIQTPMSKPSKGICGPSLILVLAGLPALAVKFRHKR